MAAEIQPKKSNTRTEAAALMGCWERETEREENRKQAGRNTAAFHHLINDVRKNANNKECNHRGLN